MFLDADVVTLSQDGARAEAVAVKDERVAAVGSDAEIGALVGPATSVIRCHGRCLLPGFHDAHLHLLATVSSRLGVDCTPEAVRSIRDIQQAIARKAAELPAGKWIRASGYDEFHLAEKRHPTRLDLDAAAPHHPVKLVHRSRHACVLNSLAIQLAGLDGPEWMGEARVDRDPGTGELTGLVYEFDELVGKRITAPIEQAELRDGALALGKDLLSKGITSVQDATFTNGPSEWRLFSDLTAGGSFGPRVTLMTGVEHVHEMAELVDGGGDAWLRPGHVKIMLTETENGFVPEPDVLFAQVEEVHRLGLAVAIHAVEESTLVLATEAIAAALEGYPRDEHRHRIEHASVAPPELLQRLAELGIAVVTQPAFVYYSGDRYLSEVEAYQQEWLYPLRSMADMGIRVAFGSDAPIAGVDPIVALYAASTRRSRNGRVVNANQAVDPEWALRALTASPACLVGRGGELGTIEKGKLADLVLLSTSPLLAAPEEMQEIAVDMTVVAGRVAWQRE